jgi:pyruvate kinase
LAIDQICTIGPATSDEDMIKELILHGMTIVRLNLSHGNHESYHEVIHTVRSLNEKLATNVKILGDLKGSKIRLGEIEGDNI